MNLFDQDGYLSWSVFSSLEKAVNDVLANVDKQVDETNYIKLEARFKQTKEIYLSIKDLYLVDSSLVSYAKVLVDLTMTTTRLTDPMWALMSQNEQLCKKAIAEVYNIQDVFKLSLDKK